MNIFRFIADMLHLAAILLLLYRIRKVRNCIGKSTDCFSKPQYTTLSLRTSTSLEIAALAESLRR